MALLNKGIQFGHSSRLGYDNCAIQDDIAQSVSPLLYKVNPNQINNCQACLPVFGPRSNSYGISTTVGHRTSPSQDLVDVESILSNRNVLASKCKDGNVNDIDVTKFNLQHARICNDFLDPIASHLTNPAQNYRELAINRFYDLPTNPQNPIFYNFAVNTHLEAIDNYREAVPKNRNYDATLPREYTGKAKACNLTNNSNCPK